MSRANQLYKIQMHRARDSKPQTLFAYIDMDDARLHLTVVNEGASRARSDHYVLTRTEASELASLLEWYKDL